MLKRFCLVFSLLLLPAGLRAAPKEKWTQLFNGKDLTGWAHVGPGSFVVENGMLKPKGGMGLLYYKDKTFGKAVLRVVYKTTRKDDNSGVYFRIPIEPREALMPVHYAFESQIYDVGDDSHCTGVIYSLTKAMARPSKPPGEWNTMEITINGPHTIVMLNGVKVSDYTEGQPVPERTKDYEPQRGRRPDSGYIGLQNHAREDKTESEIYFKEISVRPLARH